MRITSSRSVGKIMVIIIEVKKLVYIWFRANSNNSSAIKGLKEYHIRRKINSKRNCFYEKLISFHEGRSVPYNKKLSCFCLMPRFTQPTITCSKLTIETLEQGGKYVQS